MASVASQKVTPINDQMEALEAVESKEKYQQQEKANLNEQDNGPAPPPIPATPTTPAPSTGVEDHKHDDHNTNRDQNNQSNEIYQNNQNDQPNDHDEKNKGKNGQNNVIGLDDLAPRESHDSRPSKELEDDDQAGQLRFLLKQVAINRQIERFRSMFTYDYLKSTMQWFLESATCHISITFEDITLWMTLFVLFGDDIKILCSPREYDDEFAVAYAVCLFTFIFELLANSWAKTVFTQFYPKPKWTGYFLSFFWCLDLIAILSLFPDIPFIGQPIGISGISDNVSGGTNYARAGRVVRLVRLVRLVRIYKVASERHRRNQQEEELAELVRLGVIRQEDVDKQRGLYNNRQSRLGDQLSESTTRRVIIMILVMLVILPLLLYSPANYATEFSTRMLHTFHKNSTVSDDSKQVVLDTFVNKLVENYNNRFVERLDLDPTFPNSPQNPYVYYSSNLDSLRDKAKLEEYFQTTTGGDTYITDATFSLQSLLRQQAMYSILMTIFVAIMMVGGALVFTNDAEKLVIQPIERMMNMVEGVAADPLAPLQFEKHKTEEAGQYETRLLETTIEKITGLLRVGFGEAGAGIISANLSSKDSSTAINPLLPGIRIYAIFGFCDIHHFEDINRKLSNDVLKFVNHVAEIVHSSVHSWSGQCNKNLGNAFVIVWRIGDEHTLAANAQQSRLRGAGAEVNASMSQGSMKSGSIKKGSSNGSNEMGDEQNKRKAASIDLRRVPGVDILADQALIGYCKIIAEINRNRHVMKYRNEPRLTDRGKHEFKVRMGFGLHAGWAIEGAVGSLQKVDATYLSPHVNMAARLETSSKQYGVPLLASQDFFDLLSNEGQAMMRRLDVVTVKGSEVPIGIYTYDALQDQEFREDSKRQRPSLNTMVVMNQAMAGLSSKSAVPTALLTGTSGRGSGSHVGQGHSSPASSGTSTPQRRPSTTIILPGSEKPAVFLSPEDHTGDVFEQDYDMITLRRHATDPEFLQLFKDGIAQYLAGDWPAAKKLLEKSDQFMRESAPVLGGDGPSRTLLEYMGNQNFEAPKTWQGFRPLTSK